MEHTNVSNDATMPACLNETQAAQLLSVSVHTLRSWRQRGRGPAFVRLGSRIVYRVSDLYMFMEMNTTYTADSPAPKRKVS